MILAKQILKIIAIAAGLLLIGLVICPNPPQQSEVNPTQLLLETKNARLRQYATFKLRKDTDRFIPLIEGKDRLAGRDAYVLRLKPKVKHTPWSQYWIDPETKAIIAFRDWDGQDHMIRHGKL